MPVAGQRFGEITKHQVSTFGEGQTFISKTVPGPFGTVSRSFVPGMPEQSRNPAPVILKNISAVPRFSPRKSLCICRGNFRKPGNDKQKENRDAIHFPVLL